MLQAARDLTELIGQMNAETSFMVLVIKAHYVVDQKTTIALRSIVPNAGSLELDRVSLSLKVDFLVALGYMRRDNRIFFKQLNSLRNKVAHNPYYEPDLREVAKFDQAQACYRHESVRSRAWDLPDLVKGLATLTYKEAEMAQYIFAVERVQEEVAASINTDLYKDKWLLRLKNHMREEWSIRTAAVLARDHPLYSAEYIGDLCGIDPTNLDHVRLHKLLKSLCTDSMEKNVTKSASSRPTEC